MVHKECPYCKKMIKSGRHYSSHCANCKSRPNYIDKIKNQRTTMLAKRKDYTFNCLKCGKEFTLNLTPFQFTHNIRKKYCFDGCANSRIQTEELKKRKSAKVKGEKHPNYNPNKFEIRKCIICSKPFKVIKWNLRKTCKSKECLTKLLRKNSKENKLGGHTSKRAIYYKMKDGSEVYLQSSYEVRVAESLDENNIAWIRPEPLLWIDKNNVEHRYYPDFYLPEYNIYLDPKNSYLFIKDKDKIERTSKQNNVRIFMLQEYELEWKTIKNKFGDMV